MLRFFAAAARPRQARVVRRRSERAPLDPTAQDWRGALALFEEMAEAGVPPDTVTFNTLLKACAAGQQAAAAEGIFARMEEFDGDPPPLPGWSGLAV